MKTEAQKRTQRKYTSKMIQRAGVFFNPENPDDVQRVAKFDALPSKADAIRTWLDSIDHPTNGDTLS